MSNVVQLFSDDRPPVVNRRQYGPYTVPHLPTIRAERRAEATRLAEEIEKLRIAVIGCEPIVRMHDEARRRLAELTARAR